MFPAQAAPGRTAMTIRHAIAADISLLIFASLSSLGLKFLIHVSRITIGQTCHMTTRWSSISFRDLSRISGSLRRAILKLPPSLTFIRCGAGSSLTLNPCLSPSALPKFHFGTPEDGGDSRLRLGQNFILALRMGARICQSEPGRAGAGSSLSLDP